MRLFQLKAAYYIAQTLFGMALIIMGIKLASGPTIIDMIQALTLFATGAGLLLFGLTTFVLRNETDIWT